MRKPQVIVITNLYPNAYEPNRGIFIKQLIESLHEQIEIKVVAPIPWRPRWVERLMTRRAPLENIETIGPITVYHPRYIVTPKILRSCYGWFFYLGIYPLLKKINKESPIDLFSVHWAYPDGYGTHLAAKRLNIPYIVHALGCDINEYTKYAGRRKRIKSALQYSHANIVKSNDLKIKINELGIKNEKTHTILNGVDQTVFNYADKYFARKSLSLPEKDKLLLFIGNFQEEKGLTYLLQGIERIKSASFKLLIVGSGPDKTQIEREINNRGINHKIIMIGQVNHSDIPNYLRAADLLCLPSLREGCPNVVLESLSCGTPVLASNVGAVPDIITRPEWGLTIPSKSPEAIANGIINGLKLKEDKLPDFTWHNWNDNATRILKVFESAFNAKDST